jgi:rare lipoprotein A (peptidoglycan hydrolase)
MVKVIILVIVIFFNSLTAFCEEPKAHVVKVGDSINRIADKHNILAWQLRKANGMGSKDKLIHPGQKLLIPEVQWKAYNGRASWYGPGFHGKKMANGKIYDQNQILVAHRTLPLGLRVKITNLNNNKSLEALILDRGPYTIINGKYDREVDLSFKAAKLLGAVKQGVIPVKITPLN